MEHKILIDNLEERGSQTLSQISKGVGAAILLSPKQLVLHEGFPE
jgi:hypothetical protein